MEYQNSLGTSKIDDYLYALAQSNLVYNYDFRYFSNPGEPKKNIPDGWLYENSGAAAEIYPEKDYLVIHKGGGEEEMIFKQAIHEFPKYQKMLRGQWVTAKVILDFGAASSSPNDIVSIGLNDDYNSTFISKQGFGLHEVSVSFKVHENASELYLSITSRTPFLLIKIHAAWANVGKVALRNLPCIVQGIIGERKQYIATETPPPEEISLCREAFELCSGDYPNTTRLDSILNGRFGRGENKKSMTLDMRGYFSRAWDNGAKVDPNANERTPPGTGTIEGDHVSTFEKDAFEKHDHGLLFKVEATKTGGKEPISNIVVTGSSSTEVAKDGLETRPKNIAELYTIKWA